MTRLRTMTSGRVLIAVAMAALSGSASLSACAQKTTFREEGGPAIVRNADGELFVAPLPCGGSTVAFVRVVDARPGLEERPVLELTFDPPFESEGWVIPLGAGGIDAVAGVTDVMLDEAGLAAALEGSDATLIVEADVWFDHPDEGFASETSRFVVGELEANQGLDTTNGLFPDAKNVECDRGRNPWPGVFDD